MLMVTNYQSSQHVDYSRPYTSVAFIPAKAEKCDWLSWRFNRCSWRLPGRLPVRWHPVHEGTCYGTALTSGQASECRVPRGATTRSGYPSSLACRTWLDGLARAGRVIEVDLATGEPGMPEPNRATGEPDESEADLTIGEPGGPEVNVGTRELGVVSSLNSRRRAALLACFIEVSKAKLA